MPWWGWLLIAWPVVAVVGGVLLGRSIKGADRRERATRPGDESRPHDPGTFDVSA